MKTIVLQKPGAFEYTDTQFDNQLEADQALFKVHRIGICGTDYHAYHGDQPFFDYPRILGHELGVEVVEIGSEVAHLRVGDKCSVEPYLNMTNEQSVRSGFTNCGENVTCLGVHVDGGMREYMKVPARYLHRSELLTYEQLALIEPLGIGCHAVNRAGIKATDTVLVVGAGPIGLSAVQFSLAAGARTVVMDINSDRLHFASSILKVDNRVVAGKEGTLNEIRECFEGDLPTVVMDATGNPASMRKSMEYVAPSGIVLFIGLFQGDFTFNDPYFHKKELTLMSSRNALPADFKQIIKMMEDGSINTEAWITHRCDFSEMVGNFDTWLRPESQVIKAVVSL